jgi:hypothetical protein
MKNKVTIGLFLLTATVFANKSSEPTTKDKKTVSTTKVVDICSITETRIIEGYPITATATATTCEEVKSKLNAAFASAKKSISAM